MGNPDGSRLNRPPAFPLASPPQANRLQAVPDSRQVADGNASVGVSPGDTRPIGTEHGKVARDAITRQRQYRPVATALPQGEPVVRRVRRTQPALRPRPECCGPALKPPDN